jgi:raffinose synthase
MISSKLFISEYRNSAKRMALFLLTLVMLLSCKNNQYGVFSENADGLYDVHVDHQLRFSGVTPFSALDDASVDHELNHFWADSILIISLPSNEWAPEDAALPIGTRFGQIPDFKQGIAIWRYKPWNSWTKPIRINNLSELEDWDVQFFYWQFEDGTYGAVMPLSGKGYRTTLGNHKGALAAKSVRYAHGDTAQNIPQVAIGFGADPFELFRRIYIAGLKSIGKEDNLIGNKVFPKQLDYIGWCTWNASDKGSNLNEEHVLDGVKSFTNSGFPLGWVIIDDGWFDNSGARLNSLLPDKNKFPNGFSSMNKRLKELGLKEVGVWHAFNGYWNGINPESEVGRYYADELFSWEQKSSPTAPDSAGLMTYHFIRPDSDSLAAFYQKWHELLKEQGFSFLKVDNQLVVEKMAVDNYPIFDLSEKMHEALYTSAFSHFDGALINCMDMTADAYLNFGQSAVARSVEDYFPAYEGGVGYEMEKGNAAAHLIMGMYNSLYFQQMVFPDLDMFESDNPDGEFHAIARAINNGPVYVTDKPGRQNFDILRALCYSDGSLIRSDKALTPTEDCLFNLQDPLPFKAFSFSGEVGLLGIWNMADADSVKGSFSPADIPGLAGDEFVVFNYFTHRLEYMRHEDSMPVGLKRMGYDLFYLIPSYDGMAVVGLLDKYNAPGTVSQVEYQKDLVTFNVADSGVLAVAMRSIPSEILIDEEAAEFSFANGLCRIVVSDSSDKGRLDRKVSIRW